MKTGAVVVTDIVGYSKLTGDNQELALELLTEHDSIILKSIDDYNGKSLVNRGDGFVIFFSDSAKAILCSIDIQTKIKKRNKLSVKNRKFKIRIGIHTGPIIAGETSSQFDVWGDSVNIAARLESSGSEMEVHCTKETKANLPKSYTLFERKDVGCFR